MKRLNIFALALIFAGCASTGSTLHSGVGEAFLREAPWYEGSSPLEVDRVGHVSIVFQPSFGFKAEPGTVLYSWITDMNAFVDSLNVSTPLRDAALLGTAPDVQFGCERSAGAFDCDEPGHDFRHRLAIARPSRDWIDSTRASAARYHVNKVLVITLEVGNYFPDQKNLKGSKIVRLGTDYNVDLPWLTSLDKPVNVLQLTGAVMDTTGMATRIGAEGLGAKQTHIVLSGLGMQSLLNDDDIVKLRAARRSDLPGNPLVWQLALKNLVEHLTGRRT